MKFVKLFGGFLNEGKIDDLRSALDMKIHSNFQNFLNENEESKQVLKLREKLKDIPGSKSFIGLYKFYFEEGYKDLKPDELLKKCAYYDQLIRDDKYFNLFNKVGMRPSKIDELNVKLIAGFINKVKPGTEQFKDVWIIIQHADTQPKVQQKFLELHGETMQKTNPRSFNMLKDRIAINTGEQQTTLSQGMEITLNGKTGWLPWQMKGIKIEKETTPAEQAHDGKPIELVKWVSSENSKIKNAIEAQIGPKNVEKAKEAGITINLKAYVQQVMDTEFLGNYMIKK